MKTLEHLKSDEILFGKLAITSEKAQFQFITDIVNCHKQL